MAERGMPERAAARRVQDGMTHVPAAGRPALLRADGSPAPVKISWAGQRITRMVFASGKTVEFPS